MALIVAILFLPLCYVISKAILKIDQYRSYKAENRSDADISVDVASTTKKQLYLLAAGRDIELGGDGIVTQELISSLKLIAGNVEGIPEWATDVELVCFYLDGKCLAQESAKRAEAEAIRARREESRVAENKTLEKDERVAGLVGKAKYLGKAEEELAGYASKLKICGYALGQAPAMQGMGAAKQDWATAGGAASGLFGPAAGVATAQHVMNENARREQEAAARRAAWAKVPAQALTVVSDIEPKYKSVKRAIDRMQARLVDDADQDRLFSSLHLETLGVERSPSTSNVTVTMSCSADDVEILGQQAILDGTVRVTVSGSGFTATGYLSAPGVDEVSPTPGNTGFGCARANGTKKVLCRPSRGIVVPEDLSSCTVTYEPYHLWAIEA